VSRDIIANKQTEYKRLGSIINDARLAGLIDWDTIVDRTRNMVSNSHWSGPKEIVETCARTFQIDKWANQDHRLEVWIEKDALVGVIEKVCRRNDVSFFSCRGYTSQSEMWSASQRLLGYLELDQEVTIIHLGDHDPSGIDMTRDIRDRLQLFTCDDRLQIKRIALNMNQIRHYNPPPNPTKITDSRARGYIKKFGNKSWELDALEPSVLEQLIDDTIAEYVDGNLWEEKVEQENEHIAALAKVAKRLK